MLRRILTKAKRRLKVRTYEWLIEEQLRTDLTYSPARLRLAFEARPNDDIDDADAIRRIIEAYSKAKSVQRTLGAEYHESNEWLPVYSSYLKPIMTALAGRNVDAVRQTYRNFWRDPCSTGLVGLPVDMATIFFGEEIKPKFRRLALRDGGYRLRLWHDLAGKTAAVSQLVSPTIGNPYGYLVEGQFVKAGSDYLHHYAAHLARLAKASKKQVVVELGGGFGGMAYYLLRDNPDITYLDYDLPENMALAAYYLITAMPNKRIALFGETEPALGPTTDYDALLMPSFALRDLPERSAGVVFNSYSLAEMSPLTISLLVTEFMRIAGTYIFHVNHNSHSKMIADDFGFEAGPFDRIYKIPAMWNHARNQDMDEYEYLYQRCVQQPEGTQEHCAVA